MGAQVRATEPSTYKELIVFVFFLISVTATPVHREASVTGEINLRLRREWGFTVALVLSSTSDTEKRTGQDGTPCVIVISSSTDPLCGPPSIALALFCDLIHTDFAVFGSSKSFQDFVLPNLSSASRTGEEATVLTQRW
ncbi:hypothetical protein FA15DRAFT_760858 [Coprinopsis marcescibilis]|uniref:Uncharacterized protein n=1 Tax=Coprinopsis marcescibilis TaxID=230819 RepID=A0A5C3KDM3_COPMA|nr:hypothetical protein FA15DRAFT_760858 [Coprinopsis marcescibilis]